MQRNYLYTPHSDYEIVNIYDDGVDINENNALPNKIYLSVHGRYIFLDKKQEICKGLLDTKIFDNYAIYPSKNNITPIVLSYQPFRDDICEALYEKGYSFIQKSIKLNKNVTSHIFSFFSCEELRKVRLINKDCSKLAKDRLKKRKEFYVCLDILNKDFDFYDEREHVNFVSDNFPNRQPCNLEAFLPIKVNLYTQKVKFNYNSEMYGDIIFIITNLRDYARSKRERLKNTYELRNKNKNIDLIISANNYTIEDYNLFVDGAKNQSQFNSANVVRNFNIKNNNIHTILLEKFNLLTEASCIYSYDEEVLVSNLKNRVKNLKFYDFLNNINEMNIEKCKKFLSNGIKVIGPINENVEFSQNNIGHFFVNEDKWPAGIQALIYLQFYIQTEKDLSNVKSAKLLLQSCITENFNIKDKNDSLSQGLLGDIFNLCVNQDLIKIQFPKNLNTSSYF